MFNYPYLMIIYMKSQTHVGSYIYLSTIWIYVLWPLNEKLVDIIVYN